MGDLKKQLKQDHKELFTLSQQVCEESEKLLVLMNKRKIKLMDLASHKRIFLFILTRGIKTYSAIEALCSSGYAQDAAALVRSLLENLITAKFIINEPKEADEKARRFVSYKWIIFKRYLPEQEYQIRQEPEEIKKKFYERKQMVLEQVDSFKGKYGVTSDRGLLTWSGKTVKDMARIVDKDLLREYESVFRLCSRFSHPSILGDKEYMIQDAKNLVFSPLPSKIGVVVNFKMALKYFLNFLNTANVLFELGQEDVINDLIQKRREVFQLKKYSSVVPANSGSSTKPVDIKNSIILFQTDKV